MRRLSRQIRLEQSFGQRDLDGWEARLVDLARDCRLLAHAKGQRLQVQQGCHADRGARGPRRAVRRSAAISKAAQTPISPPVCKANWPARPIGYQALKQAGGALDFKDLLVRARDLIRNDDAGARAPAAQVRPDLRRRIPGHRSDPGRDSAPTLARSTVPGKLFIVGDPKQAIYRFRGTDVGTYWHVRDELEGAWRSRAAADDELSQRPRDSAVRQRGLQPRDDRRPSDAAGRLRRAVALPARGGHRSRRSSRCRCRSRTDAAVLAPRRHPAKPIDDSLPDAVGAYHRVARRTRAAGPSPRSRRTARNRGCRCSRGTSRCCSGDSSASATTSRAAMSTRSRRAAFRICSSAARRFTAAKRSRRSAPRSRRSSGRTTSCRCSRRSRARCSRSTTSTCSSSGIASASFHPFRVPKELGGNGGQELALTGEPTSHLHADRRRAASAAAAASPAQLSAGRRHDRPAARGDARARRVHPASGRRAGAGQRAARRGARAAVRGRRRHFVPRLHRRAARRGVCRSRGGADSRGGQRRRAADDGAQGEGARVSGRDPRRSHLPDEPRRRQPLPRRRARTVRDEDWRVGAARAATITRPKRWRAIRPRASGSRTSRRPGRAICWSCPRSATRPGRAAGSDRSIARCIPPMDARRTAAAGSAVPRVQVEGLGAPAAA